jgi:hypothetical protein
MSVVQAGGCGCGRGSQGSGCGCGCASAVGVARDGAFTRPVFFDGQLLTSDDLQALAAYARGKDRLHNRYLVGSGVVCGLEVVCSRADTGGVVVRAGYALDCCGNDIVVACDQQVDLVELVAELSGDGCTDPCPPPAKDTDKDTDEDSGQQAKPPPRRYELVVEYAETAGDLVAPYASGDESSRACEPTRYHEGYRFALRCPDGRCDEPTGLLHALTCCADAERYLERLERAASAVRELAEPGQEPIAAAPGAAEVEEATKKLQAAPNLPAAVTLASMAVRLAAAGEADRARVALKDVRDMLPRIREATDDPLNSARVDALDRATESLTSRIEEPARTRIDRQLAEGVVSGKPVSDTLRSLVTEARDWALCWLEERPATRCRAIEELTRVSVPADDHQEELSKAAEKVSTAIRQILVDCVCAAVNPPCAPCEDLAVVLAEVKVEGCEVVEICNLVRRYPLTGTALRYWLPIDWLLCEVERICRDEVDARKVLGTVRTVLRALGGRDHPPPAPDPLALGQRRLLKMLNSQVQSLQAKVRKLEQAGGQPRA